MSLDLDITPSEIPVILRQIEERDLARLQDAKSPAPAHHKRISQRHHYLARCIATGMKIHEAAIATGYQPTTVSLLQRDPSFQELVEFYGSKVDDKMLDLAERLQRLSADALDLLQDRLENEPEKLTAAGLLEIAKMGADRTGYGPSSTNVNFNGNALADRLADARKRVEAAKVIDVTPEARNGNEGRNPSEIAKQPAGEPQSD